MSSNREFPPPACMLDATEYAARLAWIAELNKADLDGYARDGHRIRLRYRPAAAARARELIRREQECCPFLVFNTEETREAFVVIVDVPTELATVANALFASSNPGHKR